MLKGLIKHRPKQVLAVYVEPEHIQVLKANRKWRKWEIDPTEHFALSEGETLYDGLQRINLRPRGRHATALILFLPRTYYSFHREHYPATLGDRLEEALTFDWQENIFHEQEHTLHFFGQPVTVNQHLSVPIFSLQRDIYEKFHQAMGASAFEIFAVIPSALTYGSFFPSLTDDEALLPIEMMGRFLDSSHLEIHRFYNGTLLDSMVLGRNQDNLRLFRENLLCLGDGECQGEAHIHIICSEGECIETYAEEWKEQDLILRAQTIEGSIVTYWLKYLLKQDQIQCFDAHLLLKPWKVPRIAWALLFVAAVYSLFAAYNVHSFSRQKEALRTLKKQNAQLETQWKPIEQLQTRIAKFMEDQKTLSTFNVEGYPLLEILTVLSQATPPDTWLNYLSVRKGQLMLRGESKSAIKYLPELSKIDGFTDVRFASPVTKNPTSDQERFNVQIQLDLEKFKKTIEAMPAEKSEDKSDTEALSEPPAVEPPQVNQKPAQPAGPPRVVIEEDASVDDDSISVDDSGDLTTDGQSDEENQGGE